jgi:hypothetical protein
VTARLRNHAHTRDVKILNATTHVYGDEIENAAAAGVNATLVLPATPRELVGCVRKLLAG